MSSYYHSAITVFLSCIVVIRFWHI